MSGLRTEELTVTFAARGGGKSVFHLVGKPLLSFHEWKAAKRRLDAPWVRSRATYWQLYGEYVKKHRLANPIQHPAPKVDPSKYEGNECRTNP